MTGGLLQLVASGEQNTFFNNNPSMTFFKQVFRTYTNYSMESIHVSTSRRDLRMTDTVKSIAKLERYGDLAWQVYLVVRLPPLKIYEAPDTTLYRARWIQNIGEHIIRSIKLKIAGSTIDTQGAEWMHVWNELSLEDGKRTVYNRMIGNELEVYDPDFKAQVLPDDTTPFVPERILHIPLQFFFNRSVGLALPLVSLQYQEVFLEFEFNPLQDLYTVAAVDAEYQKMEITNSNHQLKNFIMDADQHLIGVSSLDLIENLDVNYIFLDTAERTKFAQMPLEYIIQQVQTLNYALPAGNTIITAKLQNMVQDFVWFTRHADREDKNEHYVFTDPNNSSIIKTMSILYNGLERIELKRDVYYNDVQPYQHHITNASKGLYNYSFALYPQNSQPSGAANMSRVNDIQLVIETTAECELVFFALTHNILRIAGGMGNIAFA